MTIQEKFYEKLKADYDSFLDHLLEMPPDKILDHAYEKVMKEEILSCFESEHYLSDEQTFQFYVQNVDLDDLYNNYMKMDVSIRQMIEDCNDYFIEEKLKALPGQEIVGANVGGYDIKRAILFDNDRGFVFAHNPQAASPYVTWQFTNENGKFDDCYWDKYFGNEEDALANFVERANEYGKTNKVREKQMPAATKDAVQEERRTYKAELSNPDEPEYPQLEVFSADNDAEAVEEAYRLCDEYGNGVYLLEVHELNEDYDSIRQIDLMSHDPSLRRFMDVDLIDFLGQIADKTIIHYPNDWNIDKEVLHRAAISDDPEQKRLMWHVCSYGTHINTERDTFIKDTGAFNTWVDYRPRDEDMLGYVVEVTGYKNDGTIKGNIFEVGDYYTHSLYVRDTALILDSVSLTYADEFDDRDFCMKAGKTITVPRYEYDKDRHRLMCESGNVTAIKYHPWEGAKTMAELLQYEHATRMAMPIGDPKEHIKKIADKMAEIRAVPEEPKKIESSVNGNAGDITQPAKPTKPAAPAKPANEPPFDDILKKAQAKADAINRQRAQNKGQQSTINKNNIEIGE